MLISFEIALTTWAGGWASGVVSMLSGSERKHPINEFSMRDRVNNAFSLASGSTPAEG